MGSNEDLELENKHLKMQLLQIMEEKKSEGKDRKEFRPEVFQGRSSPDGKDNVSVKDDEQADEKKLDKEERHRFLEETLALMKLELEENDEAANQPGNCSETISSNLFARKSRM